MSSYKKLFSNTLVYFIGTLSSRLISFILVPLYTYYLTTAEYGTIDLITVTSTMLIPVVTLSMHEAVLRFSLDKTGDKDKVIKNAMNIFILGYIILLLFFPVLGYFGLERDVLIYLYLLVFTEGLCSILGQYARGIGNSKAFALNGVIRTLFKGLLSILFVVYADMGVFGYMLAFILSDVIGIIHLVIATKFFTRIRQGKSDRELSKTMLRYSIPLIPNSLLWSLITSSSKYIINGTLGVDANGIYAVSTKIPTLINLVSQVFSQAWQLTIMEDYEEGKDTKEFYSNIFRLYSTALFLVTAVILVVLKPAFAIFFAEDYFVAWEPVPFLLLGSVFSAFSGFLGAAYTASKNTSGTLKTSIYGGAISLVVNLLLIPQIGLIGAGLSSMVSYLVMFIVRFFDTKKYIEVSIDWFNLISNIVLVLAQTIVLFINLDFVLELVILLVLFIAMIIVNIKTIKGIWDMLVKLVQSFRGRGAGK